MLNGAQQCHYFSFKEGKELFLYQEYDSKVD